MMVSRSLAQPAYLIADFILDDLAMISIKLCFNPEGVHLMRITALSFLILLVIVMHKFSHLLCLKLRFV